MVTASQTGGAQREHVRRRRAAMAVTWRALAALSVGTLLAGCDRSSPAGPDKPGPPTTADYAITQWVAVLGYGPDAFALYPGVEAVGKVVGVYAFTDRWGCYDGFPPRTVTDADDWFLGLASQDKAQLDRLVAEVGRTPLIQARVRSTCVLAPPLGDIGQAGAPIARASPASVTSP